MDTMNNDPIFDTLQSYLATLFPDRAAQLLGVLRISNGWECEVYGFRVQFGTEQQDFILRIYPGDDFPAAAGKAEGEFRTLSLLGMAGYPVPHVEHLQIDPGNPFGKPFIVMELIHGRGMWEQMFHDADPAVRAERLQTFCKLFVDLHKLPWQEFVPEEFQVHPATPTEMIERQFQEVDPVVKQLPLEGFMPVIAWLQARKTDAGSMRVSILHGDFHPENILRCEDGRVCVIDWTGARLSDYRFDLAWTLLLILGYEGREAREAILREYERQAGAVEQLAFFDVVACLRRLYSIAASIKYGAEKLGMRPGAEDTMRQQTGPIRRIYELLQERTGIAVPEIEQLLLNA